MKKKRMEGEEGEPTAKGEREGRRERVSCWVKKEVECKGKIRGFCIIVLKIFCGVEPTWLNFGRLGLGLYIYYKLYKVTSRSCIFIKPNFIN